MKLKLYPYLVAALCAVLAVVSCDKAKEEDYFMDPLQEREVFLSASMGLDTRAVSVSGEAITATWQEGDELPLVLGSEVITTLKVTSIFGNKAMLSGTVKGAYPAGTSFDLYYGGTSYMYYGQDGTAQSASLRAYLKAANVKIASQDNRTLTLEGATLQHQQAYFELQFQWGPDLIKVRKLTVENMDPNLSDPTVIPGNIVKSWTLSQPADTSKFSGTGNDVFTVYSSQTEGVTSMFFAMRDNAAGNVKYRFTVTDVAGRTYTAHAKDMNAGPVQNGRFYSGIWLLDQKSITDGASVAVPQGETDLVWDAQPHDLLKSTGSLIDLVSGNPGPGTQVKYFVKYFAPQVPINVATAAAAPAADAAGVEVDLSTNPSTYEIGWVTDLPTPTETGTYYIFYKIDGGDYYQSVAPASIANNPVVIAKREIDVTPPTGIANLKYTGSAQALVNAGSVKDKLSEEFDPQLVMEYYVDSLAIGADAPTTAPAVDAATGWSEKIPRGTNAKDYYVWYKVDGSAHFDSLLVNNKPVVGPIKVTIAKTDAVIANPEPIVNLIYNGEYQQLVLPADASDGCKVYYYVATSNLTREQVVALGDGIWLAPADLEGHSDPSDELYTKYLEYYPAPRQRDADTYYVWTKVVDASNNGQAGNNYSGVPGISEAAVVAQIAPIAITVTAYPQENWTYDGESRPLMDLWMTVTFVSKASVTDNALDEPTPAKLYYKFPGETSFTLFTPASPQDIPDITNAGSYTVQYYVEGAPNFESYKSASDPASFTVEVSQATLYVTLPSYVTDDLTYAPGEAQRLLQDNASVKYYRSGALVDASLTEASLEFKWAYTKIDEGGGGETPSAQLPLSLANVKGTNAGDYTVSYKVKRNGNFVPGTIQLRRAGTTDYAATSNTYNSTPTAGYTAYATPLFDPATKRIKKVNPAYDPSTGPVAVTGLVYNGSDQALVSTASVPSECTLKYKVSNTNSEPNAGVWTSGNGSTDIPTGNTAGTYYVWYKIIGNSNYNDSATGSLEVSIDKAPLSNFAVNITGWTYGQPANSPSVSGNTGNGSVEYTYKVQGAGDDTYIGTAPTNAGNYTVRAIAAATTNYKSAEATKNFTIAKADMSYSPPTANSLKYDPDHAQNLVTAGSAPAGFTMQYSRDNSSWSASVPMAAAGTSAGTSLGVVYYRILGDNNYNSVSGSVNIPNMAPARLKITIVSDDPCCSWSDNNHRCDITLTFSVTDSFDLIFRVSPRPSDVNLQNGHDDGVPNQFYAGYTHEWGDGYVQCKVSVSKPWNSITEPKSKSYTYTFTSNNSNYADTTLYILLTQTS